MMSFHYRAVVVQVEWYDRSFQENEDLGLNDMKTEGYETDMPEGHASLPAITEAAEDPPHLIPHRVGTDHPTPFTKGREDADDTRTDGVGTLASISET